MGVKKELELPKYPEPITRLQNSKNFAPLPICPTVRDAIADLPEVEKYLELLERDSTVAEYGKPSSYAAMLRGFLSQEDDYSYSRLSFPWILTSSLRIKNSLETQERFQATEPGRIEPISHFHKLDAKGICPTLRAGTDRSRGSHTTARPIHPFTPRVITVREAARLHSYSDWFRFHKTKLNGFKQVGNSVLPSKVSRLQKKLFFLFLKCVPALSYSLKKEQAGTEKTTQFQAV